MLLGSVAAPGARAQSLAVLGDRFTVDGQPRFLTFISYFGAMGADNVTADLRFIRSRGFDGVRIWPNLQSGSPPLMNTDGTLHPEGLDRLRFILDRARDQHLIVDVTFTAEHIAGLDAASYRTGILAATAALRPYDSLLFDIENERDVYGPFGRPLSPSEIESILTGIKSTHPARIVTASNSPGVTPGFAADFTAQIRLDVTAYHEPRVEGWYLPGQVESVVAALRANGRPAYLQEPSRYPYPSTDRAEFFQEAWSNAKLAGAAAWCFHTDLGFDLRDGLFQSRIESRPEPDWNFVRSLITRVNLRTSNGRNYLMAEDGGGGNVRADSTAAGPWETFRIDPVVGGPLVDGDRATLATFDETHYLQAADGGGAALRATGERVGPWETFVIEKPEGGAIHQGDTIRLRTIAASWYVSAEGGGGGHVNVNSPSPGQWEAFSVVLVP
jgi:hypothetical protein